MTWAQARERLSEGDKVKRPQHYGYYFLATTPGDSVIAYRGITSLPSVMLETAEDLLAEDWEVTDGGMGFEFALSGVKIGRKMKRLLWHSEYIYMAGTGDKKRILFMDRNMGAGNFMADQSDMLAEDWVIME